MISTTSGHFSDGPTSHMDFTPRTFASRGPAHGAGPPAAGTGCSPLRRSSPTKANMRLDPGRRSRPRRAADTLPSAQANCTAGEGAQSDREPVDQRGLAEAGQAGNGDAGHVARGQRDTGWAYSSTPRSHRAYVLRHHARGTVLGSVTCSGSSAHTPDEDRPGLVLGDRDPRTPPGVRQMRGRLLELLQAHPRQAVRPRDHPVARRASPSARGTRTRGLTGLLSLLRTATRARSAVLSVADSPAAMGASRFQPAPHTHRPAGC